MRTNRFLAPTALAGVAILLSATACGRTSKSAAHLPFTKADIERAANRQTFVGKVDGTDAYVAVEVVPGRAVRAYVCDGHDMKQWFSGDPSGDVLRAAAETGAATAGATLAATRSGDVFTGTVDVAGTAHPFTAARAAYPGGLYLAGTPADQGDLRGAWIVLGDGTFRGTATKQGKPVESTVSPQSGEATVGGETAPLGSGGGTGLQPLRKSAPTVQESCKALQDDYAMYDAMAANATDPAIKKHFQDMRDASLQMAVNQGCFRF
jgi:hypothetical protein